MTIAELIAKIKDLPPDTNIRISISEDTTLSVDVKEVVLYKPNDLYHDHCIYVRNFHARDKTDIL